ncbi:MAG: hypothetical protein M3T56_12020 [Chloroflexota bacterium]|nr:hypothetical protein [Chloroflexota bacterium]
MQFANGLTVTVDTNAIRTDPLGSGDTFVRSRWTRPDQLTRIVELIMGQTRGGLYWRGTFMVPS